MKKVPRLSFWQIWNVSCGLLVVQLGFALQSSNASRILTSPGAAPHYLLFLGLVVTTMGAAVQTVIGAASDKTRTRIGRKSPYITGGAIVSIVIPRLISLTSRKTVYSLSLLLGVICFICIYLFSNQYCLLLSMAGGEVVITITQSIPNAISSGIMGLFNLSVVIPQILCRLFGEPILRSFFRKSGYLHFNSC